MVKDILSHPVSAERKFLDFFKNMLTSRKGLSEDFEINNFNNVEVKLMKEFTPDELIRYFSDAREMMSDWANQVSADELEITGNHPAMGEAKLGEMIKMVYLHNIMHLCDIKEVI